MVPDATYQPKVYRKQGGDEWVIASGGKVTVEDGGRIAGMGLLVAASDAPEWQKSRAWANCDGVADDVEIQAAIDALPAGGGKVVLSEGTFNIAATITAVPFVRLVGQGKGSILFAVASLDSDIIDTATGQANRYIEISDLKIDGNKANNASGHAINFFGPRQCLIERVWFVETTERGLLFRGDGSNRGWLNWVSDCEFDRCGGDALYLTWTESDFITRINVSNGDARGLYSGNNDTTLELCYFDQNAQGVLIDQQSIGGSRVVNCFFDNTENGHGLELRTPSSIVTACAWGIGANGSAALYLGTASDGVRVIGNDFSRALTSDWAVKEDPSGNPGNIAYIGNNFTGPDAAVSFGSGTGRIVRHNTGYATENKGTGSIASGATSAVITHGLAVTPAAEDISVMLKENPTNTPGAIWVDTITATEFTVNCENDPGASNLDFGWRAVVL